MLPEVRQEKAVETYWVPGQYLKYETQRLRPALELIDRIPLASPRVIYDLGCGSGHITRFLAKRWSSCKVYGIDNSSQMLSEAVSEPSSVHWVNADICDWAPLETPDLIYSNAALHWVDNHFELFPRLINCLRHGGCLAVQMPLSWDLPSHRLMRDTLAKGGPDGRPFGDASLLSVLSSRWVENADSYKEILLPCTQHLDIWETEYLHELQGDDPVFEWVRGSGLRPILNALDDADRDWFVKVYKKRLREAYPKGPGNRTLYPFRRLFIIALT